jgi:hypothetical protein
MTAILTDPNPTLVAIFGGTAILCALIIAGTVIYITQQSATEYANESRMLLYENLIRRAYGVEPREVADAEELWSLENQVYVTSPDGLVPGDCLCSNMSYKSVCDGQCSSKS